MEGFVGGLRCCFGHGVILFVSYAARAACCQLGQIFKWDI